VILQELQSQEVAEVVVDRIIIQVGELLVDQVGVDKDLLDQIVLAEPLD
jgi:hypothetical protein